ncbi:hypothetical protein ACHAWF_018984 [Thalassiosira exigua]
MKAEEPYDEKEVEEDASVAYPMEVDDKDAEAGGDAKPGVVEPVPSAEDGSVPAAVPASIPRGADSPEPHPDLDFAITPRAMKNTKGALMCRAVGCPKNCQGNSAGFCRAHHNRYLIATGRCDSWLCVCGERIVSFQARCGRCHRWRGGKTPGAKDPTRKNISIDTAVAVKSEPLAAAASSPPPSTSGGGGALSASTAEKAAAQGLELSPSPIRARHGRNFCRVVNCGKMDQTACQGLCKVHFNELGSGPGGGGGGEWICDCGEVMNGRQRRCGGCHKWKGGKRDAQPRSRDTGISTDNIIDDDDDGKPWTCSCGNVVPAGKTRCGNCHHWRAGKRKGGWKLGSAFGRAYDSDDGIDRTQDWTCCGMTISANRTRCGTCNGWRGGKRVAAGSVPIPDTKDSRPPWECGKCRIFNPGSKRRCGGCMSWKGAPGKSGGKAGGRGGGRASGGGGGNMVEGNNMHTSWKCNKCNYDNFGYEWKCFVCVTNRPNWQWYKKQQLISKSTTGNSESQQKAQASTVGQSASTQATAAEVKAANSSEGQGAAVSAPSGEGPDRTNGNGSKTASSNDPGNTKGITIYDGISMYGRPNEKLGYPYISLHYDFNLAFYRNNNYCFFNHRRGSNNDISAGSERGEGRVSPSVNSNESGKEGEREQPGVAASTS